MKRGRNSQPELRPVYVRPTFDRHERAAARAWRRAAYCGPRHRPKPGDFDPLWLRLGLRATLIDSRAGWVVSNPIYDASLRRNPHNDPSLPGPGWLWEVYRHHAHRGLVTLPSARRAIEQGLEMDDEPHTPPSLPAGPVQQQLFSAEEAS